MKLLFTLLAVLSFAFAQGQCTTTTFPSTGCPNNTLTVTTCMDGVIPATITATGDGYTITFDTAGIDWSYVQGSAYVVDRDPNRCSNCTQTVAATGECGSTPGSLKPSYTCSNNPKVYTLYPGITTYNLRLIVLVSRMVSGCTYTYHYKYHDFSVPSSAAVAPPPAATTPVPTKPGKKR